MLIRTHRRADIPLIARLYFDTVRYSNSQHYDSGQIEAWAPRIRESAYWQRRFRRYKVFVAEEKGSICGFAELNAETGHIDCFYVHHQWQRQGVGRRLMRHIEADAKKRRLKRMFADVSITARPFFLAMDFAHVRAQKKFYRGRAFKQFFMAKTLSRK